MCPFFLKGGDIMKPICAAIIVAAGKGKRMGAAVSKQFLPLGGKEILAHTVEVFERANVIREIILVTGADSLTDVAEMKQEYGWKKITAIVPGGAERQDSVWNGLQQLAEDVEIVVVHDGVRPFVTESILQNAIDTAAEMGGCVAGMPVKDTIKVCDAKQMAVATPERSTLWQIQTPQTFRKAVLLQAYRHARESGFLGTDDASLVERDGGRVQVIEGSYRNIKITTGEDLLIGEAFLKEEQA